MRLQKIIQQLNKNNYTSILQQLKAKKAEKFLFLLTSYRQKTYSDKELLKMLNINPAAFYTLKSRLEDRIQEFLFKKTKDDRIQLLRNVANIDHLVFKTQRETAIGVLKKMEIELLEVDMANELIIVYRALKKLHLHSAKYYEYSQLYNKYVAFNLGQEKAEEILNNFCKTLSEYYLTKDHQLLEILVLHKREMQNVCRLYKSHHLKVHQNILNIHFALFCEGKKEMENDDSVENMLIETLSIIESHLEHPTYKHLIKIIDLLYFEYYHQLKLYKNASAYYDELNNDLPTLLLCSHSSFAYHFLISKIEFAVINNKENTLYNEKSFQNFVINIDDRSSFVLFQYYKASTEFYSNRYTEAITTLNKLLNVLNFIDQPFVEIETKLFLSLLHILNGTQIQASNLILSMIRKISKEKDKTKYHTALAYIKLLKTLLSSLTRNKSEKLSQQIQYFNLINTGTYKILGFVNLNEKVLKMGYLNTKTKAVKK